MEELVESYQGLNASNSCCFSTVNGTPINVLDVTVGLGVPLVPKLLFYVFSIALNMATMVLARKKMSSKRGFKLYMQHMCMTQICFIVVHLFMVDVISWYRVTNNPMCYIYFCFVVFLYYLLTFQITLLSVDRWAAVHLKLRYQRMTSGKVAGLMVIIIWLLSVLATVCTLIGGFRPGRICTFVFILETNGVLFVAVTILTCILVTIVTSVSVAKAVRRKRRVVMPAAVSCSDAGVNSSHQNAGPDDNSPKTVGSRSLSKVDRLCCFWRKRRIACVREEATDVLGLERDSDISTINVQFSPVTYLQTPTCSDRPFLVPQDRTSSKSVLFPSSSWDQSSVPKAKSNNRFLPSLLPETYRHDEEKRVTNNTLHNQSKENNYLRTLFKHTSVDTQNDLSEVTEDTSVSNAISLSCESFPGALLEASSLQKDNVCVKAEERNGRSDRSSVHQPSQSSSETHSSTCDEKDIKSSALSSLNAKDEADVNTFHCRERRHSLPLLLIRKDRRQPSIKRRSSSSAFKKGYLHRNCKGFKGKGPTEARDSNSNAPRFCKTPSSVQKRRQMKVPQIVQNSHEHKQLIVVNPAPECGANNNKTVLFSIDTPLVSPIISDTKGDLVDILMSRDDSHAMDKAILPSTSTRRKQLLDARHRSLSDQQMVSTSPGSDLLNLNSTDNAKTLTPLKCSKSQQNKSTYPHSTFCCRQDSVHPPETSQLNRVSHIERNNEIRATLKTSDLSSHIPKTAQAVHKNCDYDMQTQSPHIHISSFYLPFQPKNNVKQSTFPQRSKRTFLQARSCGNNTKNRSVRVLNLTVPSRNRLPQHNKVTYVVDPVRKRLYFITVLIAIWHCLSYLPVGVYFSAIGFSVLFNGNKPGEGLWSNNQNFIFVIGPMISCVVNPIIYCWRVVKFPRVRLCAR